MHRRQGLGSLRRSQPPVATGRPGRVQRGRVVGARDFSLGISPGTARLIFLISATAATAAVISVSGIVNWVGLIVPHISRRLFRADTRQSLPAAMLLGGIFTIFCDTLARTIFAGEIPLGIFTSMIGAGAFIILLLNRNIRIQK